MDAKAGKATVQLTCNKGYEHKEQPIIMICMDEKCRSNRLCCLSCIDELHCKHELISIKKFQNFLCQVLKIHEETQNKGQLLNYVKETHGKFNSRIEQLKEEVVSLLNKSKQQIDKSFNKIYQSFDTQKYSNCIEDLYETFCQEKVDRYYDLAFEVQKNNISSKQQAQKMISTIEKTIQVKSKNCIKDVQKHVDEMNKALQKFVLGSSKTSVSWHFSNENKANCLILEENGLKAKRGEGAGGYPIVLCSSPLTDSNNEINVTITEQPGNKGCWVGICSLNIVKNYNFQSCYGIGKGTYAIDQVGQNHMSAYSWSHHDPNFNSAPKVGFQFSLGDIINIKVDYDKGVVRFTKGEHHFEQPIKLDIGEYYPFVGPTNLGDAISIAL